jgi:hypothetical protein
MNTARLWLLFTSILSAAVVAYLARDVVQNMIVVPLAYALWQLRGLLAGVAQLVQWVILIVVVALVMAWQLVPRLAPRSGRIATVPLREGPVNATAVSLSRARSSNYFRWQLAHRLGRAASQLGGIPVGDARAADVSYSIAAYLDAGLNHSFVDYAAPRLRFTRQVASPLHLDPEDVVHFLESHVMEAGGIHADNC